MRWPRSTTIRSLTMIILVATMFSGLTSPVSQLLGHILPVREIGPVNAVDPDFILLPPMRTNVTLVQGGGSLSSTITATADVSMSVTFSIASTLPAGVTVSFTNNPCNTSCTVAISFSASSTASTGTTSVIVQAVGGGNTHTKNLLLTVYPLSAFDFTLQPPSRSNVTLVQGGGSLSSSITAISFTNMSLTFSIASGLPTGVTPIFTSNPCNTNCTATVSLSASSTAITGTTTLTIQAVGGGVTHTTSLLLTVYAASAFTFSLSASPSSLTVVRGSVSSSSSITAISFTNMSLTFSIASTLPTGVTAGFSSNPCNTNCTAAVSFSANATATIGTTTVAVRSAGGSVTRTTGLSLTVYPLSVLGLDCAYGSSADGSPFPSSVTTSFPYSGSDFDGTLDTSCQATYLADTDLALHPLVSDNPSAVVAPGAGGGLTIDVVATMNPVTTLNGFDVSLNYDTKVLSAVTIDQSGLIWGGTNLPPGAFVLTIAKTIDNINGVVRLAQVMVGAPQQGGDSELFRVRFDIVGASTGSPVTIFNDQLLNPGAVAHVTRSLSNPGLDTTSIYNALNAGTLLNAVADWTFSPKPEVAGSPLTFTASATCPGCTGTLTYTWDFSSSDDPMYVQKSQATGISTIVTGPPPAINRVTLTIRDAANPADSISVTRLLPLVLNQAPSSTTLTQGTAGGTWSGQWLGGVTTSSSGYTGSWTFCPGSAIVKTVCSSPIVSISQSGAGVTQTSSIGALTYNFAGLYNATLKIADTPEIQIGTLPAGNKAVSSFLVNVTGSTPAYTVAVGTDKVSPGVDQIVTFTTHATYASNYPAGFRARSFNYIFNFGDGTPSFTVPFAVLAGQNASATHTYHSSGKFVVKVVAQETGAGVVSQIIENGYLEVGVGIICSAAGSCGFTISPVSPVTGQSLTFNATASGGTSPYAFSWSFGDGSTATGATPNHTYQTAGTYNVTVTITDSAGQTQTVHKTVTVGPGNGGGGGFDFASLLTSPPVLAGIAAAVIIIPTTMLYIMRRRRKSIQPNLS